MDTKLQKILVEAFQANAIIGMHIDLQKSFGSAGQMPHFATADELANNLRKYGQQNIWVAYNDYDSGPIPPQEYQPLIRQRSLRHPIGQLSHDDNYAFEGVSPHDPDIIFSKKDNNALLNKKIAAYLDEQDPSLFIISGMHHDECIPETIAGIIRWQEKTKTPRPIIVAYDATDLPQSIRRPQDHFRSKVAEHFHSYYARNPRAGFRNSVYTASVSEIQDYLQPSMAA